MSVQRDPDAIVADWLEEGPTRLPHATRRAIAVTTRSTTQSRRRRPVLWRSIMTSSQKLAVAAVIVLAVGMTGLAVLGPGSIFGPANQPSPTATPSQAIASAAPANAGPATLPLDADLAPGDYSIGSPLFPVTATFDVPSGWAAAESSAGVIYVFKVENALDPSLGSGREVSFVIATNVVADPCDPTGARLDPPVGPSVGDLVTAVSNLPDFAATAPTDVTIDGHPGQEFALTAPSDVTPGCLVRTWSASDGPIGEINQVAPGEINLVRVLDIDGTRLMITAGYFPATTSSDELAELRQVFDSVGFGT